MSGREQILTFLRDPKAFSGAASDPDVWRAGLAEFAESAIAIMGEYPLRPAQVNAWNGLAEVRAGLVLGPPGTGKTHLLSWLILGYIHARREAGLSARVFVTAFTRNAIGNLLDVTCVRAKRLAFKDTDVHYVGAAPPAGLSPGIKHRASLYKGEGAAALADLQAQATVMGGSIWSLYRLLGRPDTGGDDGFTAELFDLICIDEASQMVLSHGLMALGGLRNGGRVVVAGDDRQLPPIRVGREVTMGQRQLGSSLYSFLKSGEVPEFPLNETFRLNGPLAAFPERKFYSGQYRSTVETRRLELTADWRAGLEPWEVAVLDPDWPIAILLHDGPAAATSNSFEAEIAARLAERLAERMLGGRVGESYSDDLWLDRLAVISPHRAQNAAIRQALSAQLRSRSFVETIDRIQGKERDAVIMSYCVADAEFALAEADFIFAPERLNVAITRARTKLIVLISRRLLDAVPSDQEQMDKAELLREFVFSAAPKYDVRLPDKLGLTANVQVRLLGFEDSPELEALTHPIPVDETPITDLSADLESLLDAVRVVSLASKYGTATIDDLRRRLATRRDLLPDLSRLHALGHVNLELRSGNFTPFWVARPLTPQQRIFSVDPETVRRRVEEVISQSRVGRLAPFYERVRRHFAWMSGTGNDVLKPEFDRLKEEGRLVYQTARGQLTVDWVEREHYEKALEPQGEEPDLSDDEFRILNALEDVEVARINFGVFEGWTSAASLADREGIPREEVTAALGRLSAAGWVMLATEGRVRSRMAELAREVRYVKQRFTRNDADRRPYLVRSLKLEVRDRDKPERESPVSQVFKDLAGDVPSVHGRVLIGLSNALDRLWLGDARMAGFQARSLRALSLAWHGTADDAFVVAADTGSGKTEAAGLPLIAAAAADRMQGIGGVRAILAYPRIRLATNQAQRLAGYLAALAQEPGMPTVTLGLQVGQVPEAFDKLNDRERAAGWASVGAGTLSFPLFACPLPKCGGDLLLEQNAGKDRADQLSCTRCGWKYGGWIGSKAKLREQPPAIFLPTTDSLHQWLHDTRYGRLFGDDPAFAPPRALLADEIHLYSHVHGAQVAFALRRLAARAEINRDPAVPMLAIGMSATLGDPKAAWARLIGRQKVSLLTPTEQEKVPNPRGREYFYFIQPEVESRGQDIAGASTTLQTVMCLAHGMRRRTGKNGGFRTLVFLDSIDKVRRLQGAYDDAETQKKLAAYRTRSYAEDPNTGIERDSCCGEPHGCDAFRDGECWFFAATDLVQCGARGRRRPGQALRVADQPVFSGTSGRVEALIKDSDVVFTTSSLEVGYDDPDITLIYQHYAPRNLASFIQRKGRAGRGSDDRPITGVTLSIYSSRDSWWFRKPREMIEPSGHDAPLNPDNHFVRRGQLLATVLDALARYQQRRAKQVNPLRVPPDAMSEAEMLVARIFGSEPWREFGESSLQGLWDKALKAARRGHELRYLQDVRQYLDWIPNALFETINVPLLRVMTGGGDEGKSEDVTLAMSLGAPGNATRRHDAVLVYWRPPVNGAAPWLAPSDYTDGIRSRPFGDSSEEWLSRLPDDARPLLHNLSPDYFRPARFSVETLGRMHGSGWQSDWVVSETAIPTVSRAQGTTSENRRVRHDSRGSLRGFPIIKSSPEHGRRIESSRLEPWIDRVDRFIGDGVGGKQTGLAMARVYWGADAEVNLIGPPSETAVFSQVFVGPDDGRPLLHGYHVQTEGVRFTLNSKVLDAFVTSALDWLDQDLPARRWYAGQMLRFLVESKAQSCGVNAYEARRGADLMVSAAGDPDLKRRLAHLLNFWGSADLATLFEDTRANLLSQHPLLSPQRVKRVAQSLADQRFQKIFKAAVQSTAEAETFRRYVKSIVVHSLAVRLKESFLQLGRGDEQRVIMHVRLPIQFGSAEDPVITICEAGAFGDGTTRSFLSQFDEAAQHWRDGFITECPNANEDAVMLRLFEQTEKHDQWRKIDPNDPANLASLNKPLGLDTGRPLPAAVLRVLFGSEPVGIDRFDLYDLAMAIHASDKRLSDRLGRAPTAWELTSAAVEEAKSNRASIPGRLLAAYAAIEDAVQDESLSPEARLAEQQYRLSARLCVDGCQACVHQASDLMSEGLAEASTSRRLLKRFLCTSP